MALFFGPTKLLPIAVDLFVLWMITTEWATLTSRPS
jgi:hypothetical protein